MSRLLLALAASALVGLLITVSAIAWSDMSFRSPDAAGFISVSLAIALVSGLLIYAPVAWLLRRRGLTQRSLGAVAIGLAANLPLFIALFILDRVGGVFAAGEALIIAGLATAIGATHGFFAFRRKASPVAQPEAE